MGMERKLGLMVENTKGTIGTLKRMGLEHSFGQMVTCIRETGEMTKYRDWETDRKSTRLNSSHITRSRMPSSA